MSDCDGYSASSGYHFFSEKSEVAVERKTVKSSSFGVIATNAKIALYCLDFAGSPGSFLAGVFGLRFGQKMGAERFAE